MRDINKMHKKAQLHIPTDLCLKFQVKTLSGYMEKQGGNDFGQKIMFFNWNFHKRIAQIRNKIHNNQLNNVYIRNNTLIIRI